MNLIKYFCEKYKESSEYIAFELSFLFTIGYSKKYQYSKVSLERHINSLRLAYQPNDIVNNVYVLKWSDFELLIHRLRGSNSQLIRESWWLCKISKFQNISAIIKHHTQRDAFVPPLKCLAVKRHMIVLLSIQTGRVWRIFNGTLNGWALVKRKKNFSFLAKWMLGDKELPPSIYKSVADNLHIKWNGRSKLFTSNCVVCDYSLMYALDCEIKKFT